MKPRKAKLAMFSTKKGAGYLWIFWAQLSLKSTIIHDVTAFRQYLHTFVSACMQLSILFLCMCEDILVTQLRPIIIFLLAINSSLHLSIPPSIYSRATRRCISCPILTTNSYFSSHRTLMPSLYQTLPFRRIYLNSLSSVLALSLHLSLPAPSNMLIQINKYHFGLKQRFPPKSSPPFER